MVSMPSFPNPKVLPPAYRGITFRREAAARVAWRTEKSVVASADSVTDLAQARRRGLPLSIRCSVSCIQVISARDSRHRSAADSNLPRIRTRQSLA